MALLKLNLSLVCLFVLIATLANVLEAADLRNRKAPQGALGVRLDHHFALNNRKNKQEADYRYRWLFSTYLVFKESVENVSPAQLQQMAIDAHAEMQEDILQYNPEFDENGKPVNLPTVITILAFDNKIILSSSQRGASGFINGLPDSPVKEALDICQAAFASGAYASKRPPPAGQTPDHRFSRKCGEIFAFHQYYQMGNEDMTTREPKARVLAVGNVEWRRAAQYMDPCGTNIKTKWGCDITVPEVGAVVLGNEGTAPYDLNEIAGGIDGIGQIQSCRKNFVLWSRKPASA
ncbi:hypothetical protein F5X68DRAFT_234617 [Plectosphaerella plurivora]|uniref:Uncharacterized protein n=1 Tax=Plectosphaerella plurivora TaxID=936078 RepID=A0A9P9A8F5_9PEZI|nr:hypothetical protein F5X68DRAFT_234617 [Plectosphaerella plurivora]